MPYSNDESEYLNKPLLMNNELEPLGDNINFILTTPKMNNEKLIREGKKLLTISDELDNDLKNRYDTREKNIMDNTRIIGKRMIQSGMNGLEESNNGEYYGDFLQNNKDTPNIIYKDDNSQYNSDMVTNNEIITNEFIKLAQKKTLPRKEFDMKYEEIKNMQNKLL
jgi:hypothetical protein